MESWAVTQGFVEEETATLLIDMLFVYLQNVTETCPTLHGRST